ncbi:lysyl oxidase homolog 3-like [Dreissena polymorpha]|nr:lysyl oxidase homolog 3-like [Dreissena polymorpha]
MDKGLVILSYVFFTTGVVTASYQGYNFTDKDIRLIGGYSALEGRVEIRIHGVWGTMCSYGFDMNDANVLCRMLHMDLRSLDYYIDGRYGVGRGPIFYLHCSGSEQSINNCPRSQYNSSGCTHSNDIGLMCVGCQNATLETSHGLLEHVNITNFGDVYSGSCIHGLSSQEFMFTCTPLGGWIELINQCTNTVVRNIRLTGDYYMEGFVEVSVGDTWLPLCGYTTINRNIYYIDVSKANIVCSMIGKR